MKHISDDELERMIAEMKADRDRISARISRNIGRVGRAVLNDRRILEALFRWLLRRDYRLHETLSGEIRRFTREARARSLRGYKGKGT